MPMKTGEGPKVAGKYATMLSLICLREALEYCKLIGQFELGMVQASLPLQLSYITLPYVDFTAVFKTATCVHVHVLANTPARLLS